MRAHLSSRPKESAPETMTSQTATHEEAVGIPVEKFHCVPKIVGQVARRKMLESMPQCFSPVCSTASRAPLCDQLISRGRPSANYRSPSVCRLPNSSSVVLSVEQLTKTYKSGERTLTVVKEISFSIAEGSTCSIVGPSGSGKTTLLGLCAGSTARPRGR